MNPKLSSAFPLFCFLAFTACTTPPATTLNDIRFGMAKSEVVSLLGQPASTSAQANVEYLTYYLKNEGPGPGLPYMVRLVDARVDSFGRFFQLDELHNRPAGSGPATLGMGAVMPYSMNTDILTQLQQLKGLRDQGVLTEEEFQQVKQRLLADAR